MPLVRFLGSICSLLLQALLRPFVPAKRRHIKGCLLLDVALMLMFRFLSYFLFTRYPTLQLLPHFPLCEVSMTVVVLSDYCATPHPYKQDPNCPARHRYYVLTNWRLSFLPPVLP